LFFRVAKFIILVFFVNRVKRGEGVCLALR
jgi:hypothetical protein